MLQIEDIGELAYGGLVTGLKRWDDGRAIAKNEPWRKGSFWAYIGIGLPSTLATSLGWMRRQDAWLVRISHGFIYGFPGFIMEMVDAFSGEPASTATVREAEAFLRSKTTGRKAVGQSTKPGFEDVQIY